MNELVAHSLVDSSTHFTTTLTLLENLTPRCQCGSWLQKHVTLCTRTLTLFAPLAHVDAGLASQLQQTQLLVGQRFALLLSKSSGSRHSRAVTS